MASPQENLAAKFTAAADGVWEYRLAVPIAELPHGKLSVSDRDRQGNTTRIERTISVAASHAVVNPVR